VLPSVFFSPPHSDMTHTSRHLVRDIASTATYGRASRLKTTTVDDEGGGARLRSFLLCCYGARSSFLWGTIQSTVESGFVNDIDPSLMIVNLQPTIFLKCNHHPVNTYPAPFLLRLFHMNPYPIHHLISYSRH